MCGFCLQCFQWVVAMSFDILYQKVIYILTGCSVIREAVVRKREKLFLCFENSIISQLHCNIKQK